jgi:hypothetical protein
MVTNTLRHGIIAGSNLEALQPSHAASWLTAPTAPDVFNLP